MSKLPTPEQLSHKDDCETHLGGACTCRPALSPKALRAALPFPDEDHE